MVELNDIKDSQNVQEILDYFKKAEKKPNQNLHQQEKIHEYIKQRFQQAFKS